MSIKSVPYFYINNKATEIAYDSTLNSSYNVKSTKYLIKGSPIVGLPYVRKRGQTQCQLPDYYKGDDNLKFAKAGTATLGGTADYSTLIPGTYYIKFSYMEQYGDYKLIVTNDRKDILYIHSYELLINPYDYVKVWIRLTGGGGGGGGGSAYHTLFVSKGAGGGGGGGGCVMFPLHVYANTEFKVVVGAGGSATGVNEDGTKGNDGSNSTLYVYYGGSYTTIAVAYGGKGGGGSNGYIGGSGGSGGSYNIYGGKYIPSNSDTYGISGGNGGKGGNAQQGSQNGANGSYALSQNIEAAIDYIKTQVASNSEDSLGYGDCVRDTSQLNGVGGGGGGCSAHPECQAGGVKTEVSGSSMTWTSIVANCGGGGRGATDGDGEGEERYGASGGNGVFDLWCT